MPSALTGHVLEYFVPAPLPELLERYREFGAETQPTANDHGLMLALARCASISGSTNAVDAAQAQRIARTALGLDSYQDSASLIRLGKEISPSAHGLREEIVFSGAINASTSQHVYAPHEVLPRLLETLDHGLRNVPAGNHPSVVAAVVGFFCANMHPFLDGNGRWTRVLAVSAGVASGGPTSAVISAVFQSAMKTELAHVVWPRSRRVGLGEYLELALRFEAQLRESLENNGSIKAANQLLELLRKHARSKREFERSAIRIFTTNAVDTRALKEEFGLSVRRLDGLVAQIETLSDHGPGWMVHLTDVIGQSVNAAKTTVMEHM